MKPIAENRDDNPADTHAADRRYLMKATAVGLSAGFLSTTSMAHAQPGGSVSKLSLDTKAFDHAHQLKPLAFDVAKLKGLSARLIESHWSNNYAGSSSNVLTASFFNKSASLSTAGSIKLRSVEPIRE
jgi:hypothetical protein